MRNLASILGLVVLSIAAAAQQPAAQESVSRLSQSASEELSRSTQELSQLRDQIATEKLPLAQELTTLEERLAQLRREHERVTRLVDAGNLELPAIQTEIKARKDELSYVSNLLDEYARTFDSKVNVSEMQVLGTAIETAKQAAENVELSASEKFQRQVRFVEVSVERLFDAVGGMRFPGVGVDLQGVVTSGQFAIIGPVALFRASTGNMAGLVIPQTGSPNPLIRPLEGAMQAGLASLVESGNGFLPLDPSRGGALKALVQKTNLFHIFEKGGPIMWPLLIASILALGTVMERLIFLMMERSRRDPKALDSFFAAVTQGDMAEAIRIGNASKFFVVRALAYALSHRETSLASALVYAQGRELNRYRRGVPILDTIITLAPLLGLLGTVVGMMTSFSLIGGDLNAPGAITGGIAEALIATAFGLGIAITSLLPFNFLNTKMEIARHELDSAASQLELLVQPHLAAVSAVQDVIPTPDKESRDRATSIAAREAARRREIELKLKREALQRQMDELEIELGQPELKVSPPLAQAQMRKD